MKQSIFKFINEVFPVSDLVLRFTFKTMGTWDNCALLAVENHQLSFNSAISRGQYAHFWKKDCFECLSLRKLAA